MQHFITHPLNPVFACGADAVGRRNSRNDVDPLGVTCRNCMATEPWREEMLKLELETGFTLGRITQARERQNNGN